MKVILKSTTNDKMLRYVNRQLYLYPLEVGQVFVARRLTDFGNIVSSTVTDIEKRESSLRVVTKNSEYMFEVTG